MESVQTHEEAGLPVGGHVHRIALLLQSLVDEAGHLLVVFHQENPHGTPHVTHAMRGVYARLSALGSRLFRLLGASWLAVTTV
jgi:hypothetical protein